MIKKNSIVTALAMVLLFTGLSMLPANGKSDSTAKDGESAKITFLNTKGEIQAQLEESAVVFKDDTGIEVEIVPCGAGTSPFEKMSALYNSGNAPTISMLDIGDLPKFEDVMLDLSGEKWTSDAMGGSLDIATINGKVLAFPFAVEGYGLIYNKTAIESATGETFDPSSIKSRADLNALFSKIQAGGTAPIIISPLDWSLAAHYFAVPFAQAGKNDEGIVAIQNKLISGSLKFRDFDAVESAMDTFDVLSSYNLDRDDPLSGTYDDGAAAVAGGDAAFWFMGNWAWPQIDSLSEAPKEFGFLPVPLDMPGEVNKISAGPTKYVSVDKSQSSPAQQEAALRFLNWLVYEDNGQNALVKTCSVIPAFPSIGKSPDDPLAASILKYVAAEEVYPMVSTFPSDHWAEVGAFFQEYLAGYTTRDEFYGKVEGYWASQK
jgi:raffinose/stachyose/melibiose transport system substrate-binding protein